MKISNWGLIEYEAATSRQLELVERVAAGSEDETLVLCSHPPVVTLGRGHVASDLLGWSGSTLETSRGGRATYHGPNQQVIYPILNLSRSRHSFGPRDLHAYLRSLERATVAVLGRLGLSAEARTTQLGELSLTGVWVGLHKIASIGIAVRKWITYHGVAINVLNDPLAFQGIRPCGFSADIMTSVEAELGQAVSMPDVASICADAFTREFGAKGDSLESDDPFNIPFGATVSI
jgi:lipoate-protein ligase B